MIIVPRWTIFLLEGVMVMEQYNHTNVEKKWQDFWYQNEKFKAIDFDQRPKFYGLIEFPYPSGAGMHVGHIRAFSSLEVVARKRRMEGYKIGRASCRVRLYI